MREFKINTEHRIEFEKTFDSIFNKKEVLCRQIWFKTAFDDENKEHFLIAKIQNECLELCTEDEIDLFESFLI